MLSIYPVEIEQELPRSHPLYVGHFFRLKGLRWSTRKLKQGLVISMAVAWARLTRDCPNNPGFIEEEILITSLTRHVRDAKHILEHFFTIKRIGFNLGNGVKSPTIVSPKRLPAELRLAIDGVFASAKFSPGMPPIVTSDLIRSVVTVSDCDPRDLIEELEFAGREDLIPPVKWLLDQSGPIEFWFKSSGRLQARDYSIWPIRGIDKWPAWLRRKLFGTMVDIENAFTQFLLKKLSEKYVDNPKLIELKYPDLVRAHFDKTNFRLELCRLLRLPEIPVSIKLVKTILMALANGSRVSPTMLAGATARSDVVDMISKECPHLSTNELLQVGERLSRLSRQYVAARRDLCFYLLGEKPTRTNQRKIFEMYFAWERECRNKIHEVVGGTGLLLHDGIDGVVSDLTDQELVQLIEQETTVKVAVK